jgi:hypothetical protein
MTDTNEFKYQTEIEELIALGIALPVLFEPNNKNAYRYVFKNQTCKNHIPQYKKNPKRMIQEMNRNTLTTSGFALSCFDTETDATRRFEILAKSIPNIRKTIGDGLSNGILSNTDGLITPSNADGHFDLYEFKDCDLSNKFKLCKEL